MTINLKIIYLVGFRVAYTSWLNFLVEFAVALPSLNCRPMLELENLYTLVVFREHLKMLELMRLQVELLFKNLWKMENWMRSF